MSNRKYSKNLVDGPHQAASRSMLRGVGFETSDFSKPLVGIASTWSKVTPCNMHINELADLVETSIDDSGCKGVLFNTITVSDGISMGTQGMKYSLVSREVIADSIETVVGCLGYDGVVAIGGCDKNMPGALIALARLNRPSILIKVGDDSLEHNYILKNESKISDEFFGDSVILKGALKVDAKLSDVNLSRLQSIKVIYQGCAEGKYCYPKSFKSI